MIAASIRVPFALLRMALHFMRGNKTGTILSLGAIACGVAQVTITDLVSQGARRAFVDVIDTMAGRAALHVRSTSGAPIPDSLADRIMQLPGVDAAIPVVRGSLFSLAPSAQLLTVQAMDLATDAPEMIYELRSQRRHELSDPKILLPNSIVLTRPFAETNNLKKGDSIRFEAPTGVQEFTLRALLEPEGAALAYGGNLAVLDILTAQAHFTKPGFVTHIDIVLDPGVSLQSVAESVKAILPPATVVEATEQRKSDLNRIMQSFGTLLSALSSIGLIAAFFIAYNRLASVFEDRRWQLGVLGAIGLNRVYTWGILMTEAVLLGGLGSIVGIALGLVLADEVQPYITRSAAIAYRLVVQEAEPESTPFSLMLAAASGICAALAAAVVPAWNAARADIATAIGTRGTGLVHDEGNIISRSIRVLIGVLFSIALGLQWYLRSWEWGLVASLVLCAMAASSSALVLQLVLDSVLTSQRFSRSIRFSLASVRDKVRRNSILVATIAIGLGSVVWIVSVGRSFETSVVERLTEFGLLQADLIVTSANVEAGHIEAPLTDKLVEDLSGVTGVKGSYGMYVTSVHYQDQELALEAFDPYFFSKLNGVEHTIASWREQVAAGEAVLVSATFAERFSVSPGQTIHLQTPYRELEIVVGGIIAGFASPTGVIWMSRSVFAQAWKMDLVTRIFVERESTAPLADLQSEIERKFGRRYGLRILQASELLNFFAQQVDRAFSGLYILSSIVMLVVFAGVAETLFAAVTEMRRSIGTLRAIGVARSKVGAIVLLQSILVASVGIASAAVFGCALGAMWVWETFPFLMGWTLSFHFPVVEVIYIGALGLIVAVGAAVAPAMHASRIDPASALRYE